MENEIRNPTPAAPVAGAAPAAPAAAVSDKIVIEDFAKVEMRVGEVKSAERVPNADKLLKLMVDIGTETRQIVAGIAEVYAPEKLVGRKVVVVVTAFALSYLLDVLGFDPRGGFIDTYVQRNALIVGFVMGFAIIPIIYTISEDALTTVPAHLRSASLGAGATP